MDRRALIWVEHLSPLRHDWPGSRVAVDCRRDSR